MTVRIGELQWYQKGPWVNRYTANTSAGSGGVGAFVA
jgi:hypothetical protein